MTFLADRQYSTFSFLDSGGSAWECNVLEALLPVPTERVRVR